MLVRDIPAAVSSLGEACELLSAVCGETSPEGEEKENEKSPEVEKAETDSVEGDKKEGEDAAAQEAEDEEDPSNLQLAWEMLELAKMVFTAQIEGAQKANLP